MNFTSISISTLALISTLGSAIAQTNNWTAADRETYTRMATWACFEKQRAAPENARMADAILIMYCHCAAARVAENITDTDAPDVVKERFRSAGNACLDSLKAASGL